MRCARTTYLSANSSNLPLAHQIECYDISQTSSLHILHNDPQISLTQVAVHEVYNVLVLAIFHHKDLIDDEIFLRLLLKIHLFDGHALISAHFSSCVDTSRSTLANLVEILVPPHRVSSSTYGIESRYDVDAASVPVRPSPWVRT